jgi:3-hydroxyisobutyrate dehydrogenase
MQYEAGVSIGFIGLGAMGEPMALNLTKAGWPLVVWNRSKDKCDVLARAGAIVAASPQAVLERCATTILMLVDARAIDSVLGRDVPGFAASVRGRTVINMATTEPLYSRGLEQSIVAAGGRYVEAPVSGSRRPAELGQLVGMLAGEARDVEHARRVLAPVCRSLIACGAVPNALQMKLAVNLFLTATVTGLAEAVHFAKGQDLDLATFADILDASPLASDVSRVKIRKLVARDFSVQASITNVLMNVGLVARAAREKGIGSPVLDVCHALFAETHESGFAGEDMAAVIRAIENRSGR